MINTMIEFREVVEGLRKELKIVHEKGLLNSEGIRTLTAYNKIVKIAPFYDDLKEFAALDEIKKIMFEFVDCKGIADIKWFLEKGMK